MTKIEKRQLQEMLTLHDAIAGVSKLKKAIRIGELLTEQKKRFFYEEFMTWVETNLPFSRSTAKNYMKLYREKDRLKAQSVSNLWGAYTLLKQKDGSRVKRKRPKPTP